MKRITILFLALLGLALVQGCTVYKATMDERSLGQIYDDESITFEIERKFLADETVKYLDFSASSYLGNVYIVGEYESSAQISRAKSIANSVPEVRSVTTYLLPKKDNDLCGTTDNIGIGVKLDKDLLADKSVHGTNVDTAVVQCNIVLLGLVGTSAEITRANQIAKAVPDARSVKSFLRVYPR